jgi:hypothetical protein
MTLRETWAGWYSGVHHPYALPGYGGGAEELVQVLMCIHRSVHKDGLNQAYVGGLVSEAIHAWKPPSTQRWISQSALQYLEGDGQRRSLREEHDPPVAFYRDQILHNESLTADHMRQFVMGMKITEVMPHEDAALTRRTETHGSWKSIRPPDAYEMCVPRIARVPYPKQEACGEHLRAKLYPRRRAIEAPEE